jgi:hypothetical protein
MDLQTKPAGKHAQRVMSWKLLGRKQSFLIAHGVTLAVLSNISLKS